MTKDDERSIYDLLTGIEEVETIAHYISVENLNKNYTIIEDLGNELHHISAISRNISRDLKERHADVAWDFLSELPMMVKDEDLQNDPYTLLNIINVDLPQIKTEIIESTGYTDYGDDDLIF